MLLRIVYCTLLMWTFVQKLGISTFTNINTHNILRIYIYVHILGGMCTWVIVRRYEISLPKNKNKNKNLGLNKTNQYCVKNSNKD